MKDYEEKLFSLNNTVRQMKEELLTMSKKERRGKDGKDGKDSKGNGGINGLGESGKDNGKDKIRHEQLILLASNSTNNISRTNNMQTPPPLTTPPPTTTPPPPFPAPPTTPNRSFTHATTTSNPNNDSR